VHRQATVQRHASVSVVHPLATNVAPARAAVTPRHVVTRTRVRKHPTKALVKPKPRLKRKAHVKAAVHVTVRKPAAPKVSPAPKVTPHRAVAASASGSPPRSGSSAVAWFFLFAVFGAIGLALFVAGRWILERARAGQFRRT
jgi:hypothetical protein